MTNWACGWDEKSGRCIRFHCHKSGPCGGYEGDPKLWRVITQLAREYNMVLEGVVQALLRARRWLKNHPTNTKPPWHIMEKILVLKRFDHLIN